MNGIACVMVFKPQVLGDTYAEMIGNLGKLAEAKVMLSIATASPLH